MQFRGINVARASTAGGRRALRTLVFLPVDGPPCIRVECNEIARENLRIFPAGYDESLVSLMDDVFPKELRKKYGELWYLN